MNCASLTHHAIFDGITADEIEAMLPCLEAHTRTYDKGEAILRAGDEVRYLGLVLEGSVNIVATYYWGASDIFVHVAPGQIFGEAYAVSPQQKMLVDAVAAQPTTVLFLNAKKLLTVCGRSCAQHHRLIQNLVRISALKNLALSRRIMHTAAKTIRGRVMSYLSEQAIEHRSSSFAIPFSRQELANYLGVDRSALSAELSRMRRDGLIAFRKNHFELL